MKRRLKQSEKRERTEWGPLALILSTNICLILNQVGFFSPTKLNVEAWGTK